MSKPHQYGKKEEFPLGEAPTKETAGEQRLTLTRILHQVVEQQHQTVVFMGNIQKELEYIRAEIHRTDLNHHKEVDRLQDIICNLIQTMKISTPAAAPQPTAAPVSAPQPAYGNPTGMMFNDPNQAAIQMKQAQMMQMQQMLQAQQLQQQHQMLQAAFQHAQQAGLTSGIPPGTPSSVIAGTAGGKPATPVIQAGGGLFGQGPLKPPPVPAATGTVTLPISTPVKAEPTSVPKMEPPKMEVKKEPTPAPVSSTSTPTGISFKPQQPAAKTDAAPSSSTSIFRPIQVQPPAPVAAPAADHDEDEDSPEEFEPDVEFKPVVPLPELVDVKTGEENEEVLFKEHCKLYRYSAETKEWKERGTGDLKILKEKKNGTYRIVMRRDQVLKLCANFKLTKGMTVNKMGKNMKACCWNCIDFSEEDKMAEGVHEQLSAKFSSVEMADEFMKLFNEGVAASTGSGTTPKKEEQPPKKEEKPAAAAAFGSQFLKKEGEWDCPGCYTRNPASVSCCPCCQTNKDGTQGEKNIFAKPSLPQAATSSPGQFSFGLGGGCAPDKSKFQFGLSKSATPEPAAVTTPEKPVIAAASSTTTPAAEKPKFSFAAAASATAKEDSTTPTQKAAGFGASVTQKPQFSFGTTASPSTGGIFGGGVKPASDAAKPQFSFATAKKEEASSTTASAAPASPINFSFKGASPAVAPGKTIFGQSAQSVTSPAGGEKKEEAAQPATSATNKIFGAGASAGLSSFTGFNKGGGSIFDADAKKKAEEELAKQKTSKFGANVAKKEEKKSASKQEDDEENDDEDEEYEPDVDFKPVIPLPDLVEVKTGEEDEEIVFKERCKLYRFAPETKEWKERGAGDIKILKNPKDNTYRVVMRREQTHKLCANFKLTTGMKIEKMNRNDKATTWICNDFSEEVLQKEQLSAKFASSEIATEYMKMFDEGVAAVVI